MRRKSSLLFPLILLCFSAYSHAQNWSGILDSSRAIDWTNAGVAGGIPSANWTQCGTTVAAGASAATINSALAGCGQRTFLLLGPGTFNLSTGLLMKPNVVLRGSGADSTFLVFSGNNSCGGWQGSICFQDSNGYYYGSGAIAPGGSNAAAWSGGYSQGATQITLTNVGSSGISVGQYIYLDQANDISDNGGLFICDNTAHSCSLEGGSPGRAVSGVNRNQVQMVKVTAINGNTYTITPGLYGANWRSGQNPGAWWSANNMQNAGVENLSVDNSNNGGESGFAFLNTFNCWVKGVRSLNSNRNHVWLLQSGHITVRDSYFFGTKNAASQSYGVESFISGDNLVENNIFQHITSPIMMGPSQGSVFDYNFSINDYYNVATWMMESTWGGHDAGVLYNLWEGNSGAGFNGDVFHGTSGLNTVFRNRLTGWETGKTGGTIPVQIFSYNRYENFVGNVLGTSGFHTTYQTSSGTGAAKSIFDLGSGNTEGSVTVPSDPLVASTMLRWGNYDAVNNANRFVSSEVPSNIGQYANSVPANQNLPSSFHFSSKPSWFGNVPWPAIGPDVSGGNIANVGGHANLVPSQGCYTNTMGGPADGGGNALSFNASRCYSASNNDPAPDPPSGLSITVN